MTNPGKLTLIQTKQHLGLMMNAVRDYIFPEFTVTPPEASSGEAAAEAAVLAGGEAAETLATGLPEIAAAIRDDVEAVMGIDPAAVSREEVVFCYPAVTAMIHYRTAHLLRNAGIPVIPRMITEMAHSATGIDINPSARIGKHFAIDHGTGIVIGETAIIGDNVTIYQGVTLGARNFSHDGEGRPVNIPRHPVIEDDVTIYSGASILGRVTIGKGSVVGGNVWLTHSVPPFSRIVQGRASESSFTDGAGI